MESTEIKRGKTTEKEIQICHHGREVYGIATMPAGSGRVPMVIFSHGYNGTLDKFKRYVDFFAKLGIGTVRYDFCGGAV